MSYRAVIKGCWALLLSSCGGVVYEYSPGTGDVVKTGEFSAAEDYIYISINSALREEAQGRRPSGGCKTWNQYWKASISSWRRNNNPQYEKYFLKRRKEMDLRQL